MESIFLIGSNSFSGATFVDYALAKGWAVHGLSRSDEAPDPFLPYRWHPHKNFKYHQLDLNKNLAEIIDLLDKTKPLYVVNFAAQSMVGESWQNPGDWFMTNAVSTIKLHDELRKKPEIIIKVSPKKLNVIPMETDLNKQNEFDNRRFEGE